VRTAADRLWDAARTGVPCAPVRDLIDAEDVDAAYAVQQLNVRRLVEERGWRICGRKIGLTSVAVQEQLGVDRPDFGALFAELCDRSGGIVPIDALLQPKVEAEVALVLGASLDLGSHTLDDVVAATDHAVAALEVVDSRIEGWDITFVDTVADNASAGRVVLGTEPIALSGIDLVGLEMTMEINGAGASSGTGAACLGNPLLAAVWLADTMSAAGTPLRAGDIVMTGALGPMAAVRDGDEVIARMGALGEVRARFATMGGRDG